MRFESIVPIFRIFDIAKAEEFYLQYLGFEKLFEHRFDEASPLYMALCLGGIELHLSEHHGDACPGSSVRIPMQGVEQYLAQIQSKNYAFYRPSIEDMPWGTRDMQILDPFGNRLIFTEQE